MKVTCHCENLIFKVAILPEYVAECNCSIGHRYDALWADCSPNKVLVSEVKEKSDYYCLGDKTSSFTDHG